MLCCIVLYCIVLCYIVLYYIVLFCILFYFIILYYVMLCYAALHCIVLYFVVLYCLVCILLYYIALHCTLLLCFALLCFVYITLFNLLLRFPQTQVDTSTDDGPSLGLFDPNSPLFIPAIVTCGGLIFVVATLAVLWHLLTIRKPCPRKKRKEGMTLITLQNDNIT